MENSPHSGSCFGFWVAKAKLCIMFKRPLRQLSALLFCSLFVEIVNAAKINAVTELFYPYQQLDENNQLVGYAIDVVHALAKNNGDELVIQLLPWSVAYQKALAEPGTMIFSIGKNQQRSNLFKWIGPIAQETLYFWALPSANIDASEQIVDFRQYRFAVIKDATTHQYLASNGFENLYLMGGTDSNASEESRIQMLLKSRADIVISTQPTILAALRSLGQPEDLLIKLHRAKRLDTELYIAFNHGTSDELVERYRQGLQQLKALGGLEELALSWAID